MSWLHCRRGKKTSRDARLNEAETRLASVQQRAEQVLGRLHARDQRNHWGETVAEIVHGRKGRSGGF